MSYSTDPNLPNSTKHTDWPSQPSWSCKWVAPSRPEVKLGEVGQSVCSAEFGRFCTIWCGIVRSKHGQNHWSVSPWMRWGLFTQPPPPQPVIPLKFLGWSECASHPSLRWPFACNLKLAAYVAALTLLTLVQNVLLTTLTYVYTRRQRDIACNETLVWWYCWNDKIPPQNLHTFPHRSAVWMTSFGLTLSSTKLFHLILSSLSSRSSQGRSALIVSH